MVIDATDPLSARIDLEANWKALKKESANIFLMKNAKCNEG